MVAKFDFHAALARLKTKPEIQGFIAEMRQKLANFSNLFVGTGLPTMTPQQMDDYIDEQLLKMLRNRAAQLRRGKGGSQ
jgi:hypothetical protein